MKTVLSVLCWIGIVVMLTGCDNGDDGGTAINNGNFPEVSFTVDADGNVTCLNADKNVITTQQICTWNCANYNNKGAVRKVTLWFDEGLVAVPSGVDEETGEITYDYKTEMALVKEDFDMCVL